VLGVKYAPRQFCRAKCQDDNNFVTQLRGQQCVSKSLYDCCDRYIGILDGINHFITAHYFVIRRFLTSRRFQNIIPAAI